MRNFSLDVFNLFTSRSSTSVSSPSVSFLSVESRSLMGSTCFFAVDFPVSFLRPAPEEDEVVFPRFLPLAFNLNGLSSGEG